MSDRMDSKKGNISEILDRPADRRSFLKWTASVGAALSVARQGLGPGGLRLKDAEASPAPREEIKVTSCSHDCGGRCVLVCHLKDGIVTRISTDDGSLLDTYGLDTPEVPQIRACLDQPENLRLARAFDAPVIIDANLRDGSLRQEVMEHGIPMLLYEAGEALRFDEKGQPLNPSLVDYRIATAVDAPGEIHGDIVETPLEDGPWGARGVGEHVMVQTAPAIANAIHDALGIRFDDLPLSAESIFLALEERQADVQEQER